MGARDPFEDAPGRRTRAVDPLLPSQLNPPKRAHHVFAIAGEEKPRRRVIACKKGAIVLPSPTPVSKPFVPAHKPREVKQADLDSADEHAIARHRETHARLTAFERWRAVGANTYNQVST